MVEVSSSWYRISAKALIFNEDWGILLCKEDNWMRDIPGWWLDRWENSIDCIKRELLEEMGLKTTYISSQPYCFITAEKPQSQKRPWISNICYEVKIENLNFIPSDECLAIAFFNKDNIDTIKVFENVVAVTKEIRK